MHLRRRSLVAFVLGAALAACSKDAAAPGELTGSLVGQSQREIGEPGSEAAAEPVAMADEGAALAARIGIEPGAFAHDDGVAPESVIVAHEGGEGSGEDKR
jgi:hypothetical protein